MVSQVGTDKRPDSILSVSGTVGVEVFPDPTDDDERLRGRRTRLESTHTGGVSDGDMNLEGQKDGVRDL